MAWRRENIALSTPDFPKWDAADIPGSLQNVYVWAMARAQRQKAWYLNAKGWKQVGSVSVRWASLLLAALGALCPLLEAAKVTPLTDGPTWPNLGYIVLSLAAGIWYYDRHFGWSSGWMRYITALAELDRTTIAFQYDWIRLSSALPPSPTAADAVPCIDRMKEFSQKMDEIVKLETEEWIKEFRASISELEKTLKAQVDALRPGSVTVDVKNASSFDVVNVVLSGVPPKKLTGVSTALLDPVAPGKYQLDVTGEKPAGTITASQNQIVDVLPGASIKIDITL